MSQQAAALAALVQRDATEVAAIDIGNVVVLREPFVQEGEVSAQQVEHAAVFAQKSFEVQLGLAAKGLAEVVVELGKEPEVGREGFEIAQVQPLPGEVAGEVFGALVAEHPAHLFLQHPGLVKVATFRSGEQFVIGNAAPEKEREPRGQRQITEAIRCSRCDTDGIAFDAEKEFRADEHRAQRGFDARLESVLGLGAAIELHRLLEIGAGHRTAIGAAH